MGYGTSDTVALISGTDRQESDIRNVEERWTQIMRGGLDDCRRASKVT